MASYRLSCFEKYVVALLLCQSYLAVSGRIIVRPEDTEASVGETVEYVCTSDVGAIEWHHLRPSGDFPEIVYKGGYIYNGYKGRFSAKQCSSAGDECRLTILNVSLDDAGKYICVVENADDSVKEEAELTVYEQYPSSKFCVTRITCSPECDTVELSCNMKYSGNVDASMEWRNTAGELVPSTSITLNGVTTSTVQLRRDLSESPTYTCQVKYPRITLESRYSWTHKSQDLLESSTAQHGQNQETIASNTIFIVIIVVLIVIISCLIVFLIARMMRKRKRTRYNSSNESPENGRAQSGDATQLLTEEETIPLMNNGPELAESWTEGEIAPRTKANKDQAIHGLSVIDDEVFIVTREGCLVEVFDLSTLDFKRAWPVAGLINPSDMVSCPKTKRIYICDWKKSGEDKEIVCVDTSGKVEARWISETDKGRLSITKESHVIVAESWYNTIKEYSSNGQLIKRFEIGRQKSHLWQAIKLLAGNFVASFGDSQDYFQDVCIFDNQGQEIRSFSNTSASPCSQILAVPRTLAVDDDGHIYVADLYNGRIIILTSELQWKGEIDATKTGERLRGPLRMCLRELNDKRQLLVADSKKEDGKWKYGKVITLDIEK